jgi:GLPGLI family protein
MMLSTSIYFCNENLTYMKRTLLLFTIYTIVAVTSVNAQTVFTFSSEGGAAALSPEIVKRKIIDNTYLECQYSYSHVPDTSGRNKTLTDRMILQIGSKVTKFYSYTSYYVDSLVKISTPDQIMSNIEKYKSGENSVIYTGYPEGKITFTDKISKERYLYEETKADFQWKILSDTKELLGYNCIKATCNFRGRNYIVWFTPDIPVSSGPWKFSGLPGLILEARDDHNEYSYALVGIKKVENGPLMFPEYQYIKTTINSYYKTLRIFREDPIGFFKTYSNVNMVIRKEDGSDDDEAMKSKPLKYDFIEKNLN